MAFIEYEKAFDPLKTTTVIKTLRKHEVKEIYVKMLENVFKESNTTIKLHKICDEITIQK